MDYTNEVFASIAKEIADRGEHVITRAFTSQIAELLQKKTALYQYAVKDT